LGMPYKGLESLELEPLVREWAESLPKRSSATYAYYLLRYLRWCRENGYWSSAEEMLEDLRSKGDAERHVKALKEFISSLKTGRKDRRNNWYVVRNFYEFYGLRLPRPPRAETLRLFRPSDADKLRALESRPLSVEEVRRLVLNAPQPYKAAIMVVFQSGMGRSEFDQFNTVTWRRIVDQLERPGPVRIDLVREKTSREEVRRYYTFIGGDAKALIREWLSIRPKVDVDALFVVKDKRKDEYVPLTGVTLSGKVTLLAKKLGIAKDNGLKRYHVHLHEFRDLFKSLCTLSGVNQVASEFFLGHVIDRLGYDKSPLYDEEWFRREYLKVEPKLNVISNPDGGQKAEEIRKQVALEMMRRVAEAFGIDPMRVRIEKQRETGRELTEDEEIRLLQNEIRKLREGRSDPRMIVTERQLERYLRDGWEIDAVLPSGRIVIRRSY